MPPAARRFIKTALLALVTGVVMGSGMLIYQALTLQGLARAWVTVHTHLLTVGFLLNMVMGVAYWMFPRPSGRPEERLANATWACLNGGLLLRFASEPFLYAPGGMAFQVGAAAAGVLQGAAAIMFVVGVWARVMSPRARLERRGRFDA